MNIKMTNTWIIVADENRGRIFNAPDRRGGIIELETLVHPESRVPEKDLAKLGDGSFQTQSGKQHHGLNEPGKLKDHEALCFAKDIAHKLEDARHANQFSQIILVAAPRFLGRLRKELSVSLTKLVVWQLDKDLSKHNIKDIRQHLPTTLPRLQ